MRNDEYLIATLSLGAGAGVQTALPRPIRPTRRWHLQVSETQRPQIPRRTQAYLSSLTGIQRARSPRLSKSKFYLRFQTAVVRRFVKALAILPACYLVGESEVRRGDVPDDRSGIRVIQQIANRQADAQV